MSLYSFYQPLKITVCYWKEVNGSDSFNEKNFPTFLSESAAGDYHIYGLPALEYPGLVKVIYTVFLFSVPQYMCEYFKDHSI